MYGVCFGYYEVTGEGGFPLLVRLSSLVFDAVKPQVMAVLGWD